MKNILEALLCAVRNNVISNNDIITRADAHRVVVSRGDVPVCIFLDKDFYKNVESFKTGAITHTLDMVNNMSRDKQPSTVEALYRELANIERPQYILVP